MVGTVITFLNMVEKVDNVLFNQFMRVTLCQNLMFFRCNISQIFVDQKANRYYAMIFKVLSVCCDIYNVYINREIN